MPLRRFPRGCFVYAADNLPSSDPAGSEEKPGYFDGKSRRCLTGKTRSGREKSAWLLPPMEDKPLPWDIRRWPCTGAGDIAPCAVVGRARVAPDDRSVPSGLTDSVVQGQGVIVAAAGKDDGLGPAAARQLPLGLAWPGESSSHSSGDATGLDRFPHLLAM